MEPLRRPYVRVYASLHPTLLKSVDLSLPLVQNFIQASGFNLRGHKGPQNLPSPHRANFTIRCTGNNRGY